MILNSLIIVLFFVLILNAISQIVIQVKLYNLRRDFLIYQKEKDKLKSDMLNQIFGFISAMNKGNEKYDVH